MITTCTRMARSSGSYLWEFLEDNWASLNSAGLTAPAVLDRLVRRCAATQLGRIDPEVERTTELANIEGAAFYLHRALSDEFRLGELDDAAGLCRVVLIPHCRLTVQPGATALRAAYSQFERLP